MAKILGFLFLTVIPLLPQLITAIVTRAAVSLGFGTATFFGVDMVFDSVISKLSSSLSGLPAEIVMMIGLVGIDDALNIMLSAGFTLFVFKGLTAVAGRASIRNSVWRKPGDNSEINWGA
ncbi:MULTISPECIES: DUF2523 family protein [Vibrio harveyi group]|uniref:DUF2523 family protein n=1 Tax=Vibrio harveyi group TaxID=717610 RepID=UPI0011223D1B|nr:MULTISPECIES: DUF2523 family protein [Vibrio harveyi group]ELB1511291.1 DUF2523 domain-containing protein [Vibrio alginolyticus]MCR9986756.1 DUF2523 domain-containing protein [Vibrio antiquarius]MCS0027085.1 DUF2523 domain-containing protein [Vibrio alginolyticus]TOJ25210.1 hypothetical protein CGI44_03210 [Vibrio parahaemolyticus]TOJ59659.1 hypothetical protein CGI37_03630 [Vibrio parahaemolyticus]